MNMQAVRSGNCTHAGAHFGQTTIGNLCRGLPRQGRPYGVYLKLRTITTASFMNRTDAESADYDERAGLGAWGHGTAERRRKGDEAWRQTETLRRGGAAVRLGTLKTSLACAHTCDT